MAARFSFPARGAAALAALLLTSVPASAQPSLCADCHFANSGGPNPRHLHEWDLSAHGRASVGCEACHGDVAAYLLSPKGLESECNSCHGRGKKQERLEYAANARILLQGTRDTRTLLDGARRLIARVKDKALRESLQYDYDQALVPLQEAAHAGHSFIFDKKEERLGVAMARAEALTDRLANLGVRD